PPETDPERFRLGPGLLAAGLHPLPHAAAPGRGPLRPLHPHLLLALQLPPVLAVHAVHAVASTCRGPHPVSGRPGTATGPTAAVPPPAPGRRRPARHP